MILRNELSLLLTKLNDLSLLDTVLLQLVVYTFIALVAPSWLP